MFKYLINEYNNISLVKLVETYWELFKKHCPSLMINLHKQALKYNLSFKYLRNGLKKSITKINCVGDNSNVILRESVLNCIKISRKYVKKSNLRVSYEFPSNPL